MKKSNTKHEPVASRMVFFCGPYKGYYGRAEFDADIDGFYGGVIGTRDVITFQGSTFFELQAAFTESVDDYLAMCAEDGSPPEQPFSGKFVARMTPELHRSLTMLAEVSHKSLNQLIVDYLTKLVDDAPIELDELTEKSGKPTRKRKHVESRAAKRAAGVKK